MLAWRLCAYRGGEVIPRAWRAASLLGRSHKSHHSRVNANLSKLQGLMKGYISRERSMVVLSKGGAFPGTGV